MLKVVVFDGGYGGEFFADQLEEELPVLEVIRVIDWRNADQIIASPRQARKIAHDALRPYIGKVDLIIFANHLLTITSLQYFRRKYKNQKFIGLHLKKPDTFVKRDILILTTKAVTRTIKYHNFLFHIHRKCRTLALDSWPNEIDDGELTEAKIRDTLETFLAKSTLKPQEIILACSQFNDIKPNLINIFGHNLKIHDSFNDAIINTCKTLRIRGGTGRKGKK
ncbi:hypothetical protein IKF21_01945 [Candidatus Saccharibacteria bacterium]|nr:hypothetical protein [Candidatus Saccharibacteria bacterium]